MKDSNIVVGLESHITLDCPSKLFCTCYKNYSCEICQGYPGELPVDNTRMAIQKVKNLCNFLDASCPQYLYFYRKHYHYPDLPKGYQLSQYPGFPFAKGGHLKLLKSGLIVKINKVLLEEDPASTDKGIINYGRSGTALAELVTEPCFRGTVIDVKKTVKEYLWTLKQICTDLGLFNGKDVLKTDVNVSLECCPSVVLQIKNVDSTNQIGKSIEQAVLLLESRAIDHKCTLHHRESGKLVYSRPKLEYLFSRELNLPGILLDRSPEEEPENVLYRIIEKLQKVSNDEYSVLYMYAKKLYTAALKPSELEKYIISNTREGLRQLQLKDKDDDLTQTIKVALRTSTLRTVHYNKKSIEYLQWLKTLKQTILKAGLTFTSKIIDNTVQEYFETLNRP